MDLSRRTNAKRVVPVRWVPSPSPARAPLVPLPFPRDSVVVSKAANQFDAAAHSTFRLDFLGSVEAPEALVLDRHEPGEQERACVRLLFSYGLDAQVVQRVQLDGPRADLELLSMLCLSLSALGRHEAALSLDVDSRLGLRAGLLAFAGRYGEAWEELLGDRGYPVTDRHVLAGWCLAFAGDRDGSSHWFRAAIDASRVLRDYVWRECVRASACAGLYWATGSGSWRDLAEAHLSRAGWSPGVVALK